MCFAVFRKFLAPFKAASDALESGHHLESWQTFFFYGREANATSEVPMRKVTILSFCRR